MPTSTIWDQIEQVAAERYAVANAPANVAVHAIGDLNHAFDQLTIGERAEVLNLLRDEIPAAAVCSILA